MTLPGMNVAALESYLTGAGVSVSGELRAELISGGRSNLTFKVSDDVSTWVVRRPPTGGLTPSAHDVVREYKVASALEGTAVPVTKTVVLDADGSALGAPMAVVEFVDGRVIREQSDLTDLTDQQVEATVSTLVRVLADLHAVDYRAVGLETFGRPDGFLDRQLNLWAAQWERVKTRELSDAATLYVALVEALPQHSEAAIVHGDYRIDNTILDDDDPTIVRAVVDWELSTLGDPLTDVALMCTYRCTGFDMLLGSPAAWTSPRLPSAETLAQNYAIAAGRDLRAWNFYLALANFKLAVIGEGIAHRALRGSDAGNGAARAADATPEFMAAGLCALRRRQS